MNKQYRVVRLLVALILAVAILAALPLAASGEGSDLSAGYGAERLDPVSKQVYFTLREHAEAIAAGQTADAYLTVGEDEFAQWGVRNQWSNADFGVEGLVDQHRNEAITRFWDQIDLNAVVDALLHDCPFSLYWFDKTVGLQYSSGSNMTGKGGVFDSVFIMEVSFFFDVSPCYRSAVYDPQKPTVDLQKTTAAYATLANARAIVAEYADASDYEKLKAYCDRICLLTEYNDAVTDPSYAGGYGDPWQAVYVFDGDPTTSVVCEGYAKAFQILCDLSTFVGDVRCYTVTGDMIGGRGAGSHMWNVVSIGGEQYIVDVTNTDTGTIGSNGSLFLAGYSSQTSTGFGVNTGSGNIIFNYDQGTLAQWGTESDSILRISSKSYQPTEIEILLPETLYYTGNPITVGEENADILYACKGGDSLTERYHWSYRWYASNGFQSISAPTDVGTYVLAVTATNKTRPSDSSTKRITVKIEKAVPTYTLPTGLEATYGDLLGSVSLPAGFAWKSGDASVGTAGVHSFIAVYTPADTKNYQSVEVSVEVTVLRAIPAYMIPSDLNARYGDLLSDIALPSGFSWQDPTLRVGDVGERSFKVVYTPSDRENYLTVTDIDVTVTVTPRDIADAEVLLGNSPVYSGNALVQSIASVKANGVDVTYTVSGNTATEIGVYTMTLTGTGNFTGTKTVEWRIMPDLRFVENLTLENVKSIDREEIEQIISLLADQAEDWVELLDELNGFLSRIELVASEREAVIAEAGTWSAESVKSSEKAAIEALLGRVNALLEGNNLTNTEKAPLREAKTNLDACLKKLQDEQMKVIFIIVGAGAAVLLLGTVIGVLAKKKKSN